MQEPKSNEPPGAKPNILRAPSTTLLPQQLLDSLLFDDLS